MAGIRRTLEYVFDLNAAGLARGARQATSSMEEMKNAAQGVAREFDDIKAPDIEVGMDFRQSSIANLRRRLEEQRRDLERRLADVNVDVDPTEAIRDLRRIERELRQLDRMDVDVEVDIDKDRGLGLFDRKLRDIDSGMQDLIGRIPVLGRALAPLGASGGPFAAAAAIAAIPAALTAAAAGVGAVGAGVGGFGVYKLLEAYSEFEASARRIKLVLGDQAADVQRWAQSVSADYGIAADSLAASVAATADLLKPQGFDTTAAADYATELNKIADALAKWGGTDFESALEAVSSGVLGEREQLKRYGVVISQAQVDARAELLKTEAQYKDLNEEQLKSVATIELIEEKSTDALRAQRRGAGAATDTINALKSAFEGLKNEAIKGFGGIVADIVSDFGQLSGIGDDLSKGPQAFADWIRDNKDEIRTFFLNLGEAILGFGDATLEVLESVVNTIPAIIGGISPVVDALAGFQSYQASQEANYIDYRLATEDLSAQERRDLETQRDAARERAQAWDETGDAVRRAADNVADWQVNLDGARSKLDEYRQDVQSLREVDEIRLQVKSGDIDLAQAKKSLDGLTKKQLIALQAAIPDDTKNKALQELEKLAKDREVNFKPKMDGNSERAFTNRVRELTKTRTARFDLIVGFRSQPGGPSVAVNNRGQIVGIGGKIVSGTG